MGLFGVIALVVNVASARVRLFSRNDAIGNAAVIIAAGLVAWTATPWPDLVVAVVIAGLFLQTSWAIINHARHDLKVVRSSA